MIHILYTAMGSFLSKMFTKFVLATVFMDEGGTPEHGMKSIEYLASIDVSKEKNQRSLKSIYIGTKTKLFFLQGDVLEETKMKFRQECLSFYVTAVTLLQKNFPFTAPVIRDSYIQRKGMILLLLLLFLNARLSLLMYCKVPLETTYFPRCFIHNQH